MDYVLKKIEKSYGDLKVLENLDMEIKENAVTCILGPSGCGKTTMMNIISGMMEPDSGEVRGFSEKTIGYLFQEPRLLSWKTVWQNMEFILKDKMSKPEMKASIEKHLKMVGLLEYKDFYPEKLSGGMKQRAAIARAFAYPSDVLIMDEPFKSLDLELKLKLINYFLQLWKDDKRTVVFVTHDIHAALILGDEINMLSEKPTKVVERIKNKLPHDERNLQNKYILSLEEKLYKMFQKL